MKNILIFICIIFFALPLFAANNCLDFDGKNDYVTVPNAAGLNPTTAITIEAWVNRAGASESKTLETILVKGNYHLDLFSQKPRFILGNGLRWEMDHDLSAADASFIGEDYDDESGWDVSGVGDVNGDGYDDFIIGARSAGKEDFTKCAGQTYLIFGKSSGWAMNTDLSAADASYLGEFRDDHSGISVSGAGDVNGDGYDDFLIGAFWNDEGGKKAGQTYLILGKSSGWAMDTDLESVDASFWGEDSGDRSGYAVSGAGDVNGDGYDDFIIGAYEDEDGGSHAGQTYLILGKASGWAMDTNLSAADASFWGEDADDFSGFVVSGAGDVNGDGYDDFIIGAYDDEDGGSSAGQTYLILGKSSGWAMDTDLESVDASFWGEDAGDRSGDAVSGAGDVNGDGYDDFLIGAYGDDDGGSYSAGQTYLILGKSTGWAMDTDLSAADASFWGEDAEDRSGGAVSGAGDVNGDGYDDFIIGAEGYDNDGQTYLILGKASGWAMDTDLSAADASFWGEDADELSGCSVSGAGDVNGDGYDDFIIGDYVHGAGGNYAGKTYLLLSSVDIAESDAVISDNTWHHITGTFDGSNVKIYVDGVLKATDARTDNIVSTTADLNIGIFRDCVNKEFKGKIEEVRIWNDVRTEAEIRANMYKELAGTESNLVAYYKFDETSGTTADNAEGTASLDGTLINMTNDDWLTSSAFAGPKNCLDFDGTNDYVAVPDHTSLNITTNLTLEAWVKLEDSNDNQKVVGKYTISNGGYMLGVVGNKLYPEIRNSTNYTFQSGIIPSGEWTHLAVTWISEGQMVGYVNGVQVNSISSGSNPIVTTGNSLIIGAAPWNQSAYFIDGNVDEVRIWNTARTAQQIRENMCKTLVGNETGLQAYYRFDQYDANGQTTFYDITSNNNHGTLNNMDDTTDWDDSEAFNTWFGSEGTSWATVSNWSDGLPTSSDNVGIINYGGSQPTLTGSPIVNNMVIGSSAILTLSSEVTVNGALILENDLALNGQTVTLGSSGTLFESTGKLTGGSNGTIQTTRTLDGTTTQVDEDVAGLGAKITTSANMGSTAIIRGHEAQGTLGIKRYYQINPTTNTGLNATLVFNYLESELNGVAEADLKLFKSSNGNSWTEQATSSVNTTDNTITISSIDGFPWWTGAKTGAGESLPVVLSSFTAQYIENTPTLCWTTQSETNNIGWNIYRNIEENFSSSQKITDEMIQGNGTTTEPSYYIYNDISEDIIIGQTYWYWLESIDLGGVTHYYNQAVNITIPDITEDPTYLEPPIVYELQSTPNPAKFSTTISFIINKTAFAEVSIYNILGKLVKTLPMVITTEEEKSEVYWNGKDENGNIVKDGIYLYQLNVDGKACKTNKLILIR